VDATYRMAGLFSLKKRAVTEKKLSIVAKFSWNHRMKDIPKRSFFFFPNAGGKSDLSRIELLSSTKCLTSLVLLRFRTKYKRLILYKSNDSSNL